MKSLWLIRHGHAMSFTSTARDEDRQLSEKGIDEVLRLKRFLESHHVRPDLMKSSSAARTVATARLLAQETTAGSTSIEVLPELYLANADELWAQIAQTDDSVQSLMLVGHNPGLEDLTTQCAGRLVALGTSAAVYFSFDVASWQQVSASAVQRVEVIDPLQIAKA